MSKKIMGAVVGLPSPRSDWNQTDENKADYIKNKPEIVPIEVFKDVYFNQIPDLRANKVDKTYVDEQISGFTSELNAALQEIITIQEDLMTPNGDGVKY